MSARFEIVRRRRLPRRTFLRGAGALVALPLLDAMIPAFARGAEGAPPRRLAFVFVPNGKHMPDWTPKTLGRDFELPLLLEPLKPVRDHVQVLSGLDLDTALAHGDGPGDHARAVACFLTGAHPVKTAGADIRVGISADQVAARRLAAVTRFPSLEIGTEYGRKSGSCDSGYACAYSNNISWRSPTTPSGKDVNPRAVFDRLFGGDRTASPAERARRLRQKRSILDFVGADARRLSGSLGTTDRRKLDEYLAGVRELEQRLDAHAREDDGSSVAEGTERPRGIPREYTEHIRVLGDLMTLAFRADLTRVATFMIGNAGSNRPYRNLGIADGHHHLSHHGKDASKIAQIKKINRFHVAQLAALLARLKAVPEGDGTLLDQTMLVYGSGIADGDRHAHRQLPILLCGGGGGSLTPGRHVRFERGTPVTNLYLSLLDRMGVREASLGDSTGRLTDV